MKLRCQIKLKWVNLGVITMIRVCICMMCTRIFFISQSRPLRKWTAYIHLYVGRTESLRRIVLALFANLCLGRKRNIVLWWYLQQQMTQITHNQISFLINQIWKNYFNWFNIGRLRSFPILYSTNFPFYPRITMFHSASFLNCMTKQLRSNVSNSYSTLHIAFPSIMRRISPST